MNRYARAIPESAAFWRWITVWTLCRPLPPDRNGGADAGCAVLYLGRRYVRAAALSVLLSAAKRGVHVRLLLDDNNTPGLDDTLRLLDSHPNIEVRLFNPFSFRTLRAGIFDGFCAAESADAQ